MRIGADDDVAREKLVRYCARPAFALERMSVLADGRIAYAIKTARKAATHRILTPVELLARIAALIPPPRQPFLRYHGVLAPASKWRKDIVPRVVEEANTAIHPCDAHRSESPPPFRPAATSAVTPNGKQRKSQFGFAPLWQRAAPEPERDPRAITEPHRRRLLEGRLLAGTPRLDWAKLLRRTYELDVLTCPRCGGPARIVAAITEPGVVRKILDYVREPPARAPPSRAREPALEDEEGGSAVWLDVEIDVGA